MQSSKLVTKEDINMMIVNFPDLGFSTMQNANLPDEYYKEIRETFVKCCQI